MLPPLLQSLLFGNKISLFFLRFSHSDVDNQSFLSIQYFSACFVIYFCIGLSFTLFLWSLFFWIFKKFISPYWIVSVRWNEIVPTFSPSKCYVYHEINIFIFCLWSLLNIFSQSFLFSPCICGSVLKFLMACSLPIF